MKKFKKTLVLGIATLSISFGYGCELKMKSKQQPIIAQASPIADDTKNNVVKIALLLDTSNSMDGLINQAKSQLWDIVNEFTHAKCGNELRPKLQIALYQYGNDGLSSREGYIQQVLNFSDDLDEISEKLFSLTTTCPKFAPDPPKPQNAKSRKIFAKNTQKHICPPNFCP